MNRRKFIQGISAAAVGHMLPPQTIPVSFSVTVNPVFDAEQMAAILTVLFQQALEPYVRNCIPVTAGEITGAIENAMGIT